MKCLVSACRNGEGNGLRGLCMKCYSAAKKKVEAGEISWEELEDLGLAASKTTSLFDQELKKKREEKR